MTTLEKIIKKYQIDISRLIKAIGGNPQTQYTLYKKRFAGKKLFRPKEKERLEKKLIEIGINEAINFQVDKWRIL